MRTRRYFALVFSLVIALLVPVLASAQQGKELDKARPDIYSGYYSREGNYAEMAESSGNSHFVKFFPGSRVIKLYIPYPYSKTLKPGVINRAFKAAFKMSSGSAYIRDTFGVMDQEVFAHLDSFRWIDNQVMYDCGKAKPCEVVFDEDAMTVIRPGIVLDTRIKYTRVKE